MLREDVIATLQAHEQQLRRLGVSRVALFGSLARGEARDDSDIDIMIDVAPDARLDMFDYIGITQYIADLFPQRVDVANRERLKPLVRPTAEADAVHVF
jgi:predicted nucleotidyltransferase